MEKETSLPVVATSTSPTLNGAPLITRVLEDPSQGIEIIRTMIDAIDQVRTFAIQQTQPEHYVLQGDLAVPDKAACTIFRKAFGIVVSPEAMPVIEKEADGSFTATVLGTATCNFTGETDTFIGERNSKEEFAGRIPGRGDAYRKAAKERADAKRDLTGVERSDLRKAALTNLKNAASRALAGIERLPVPELANRLELEDSSVLARIRKGSGHGGGDSRRAASTTKDDGVEERANALCEEILQASGGNQDTARATLQDITRRVDPQTGEVKYDGSTSAKQFSKKFQIKLAEEAWKKHDLYVAFHGGEGLGLDDRREEPGE